MKRKKYEAKNGSLRNTSTNSKRVTFVIIINHAIVPTRKERLIKTSKARRDLDLLRIVGIVAARNFL